MLKNIKDLDIQAFCLCIPGCNLSCKYCTQARARAVTSDDAEHIQAVRTAISDGTYLENTKKVFERLKQSPKAIPIFEIWGQEPTTILSYLTPVWEDWQKTFCNIQKISFSTNGMGFTDELVDFIKKIDECAVKDDIFLELQYSYDGDFGQTELRGSLEKNIVISNMIKMIEALNNYKFKRLKVYLQTHCVLSKENIGRLDTMEKVDEYFKNFSQDIELIEDSIINKNIYFSSCDFISANSQDFTTDDGIRYANFVKRWNSLQKTKDYRVFQFSKGENYTTAVPLLGSLTQDVLSLMFSTGSKNLDEYVNHYLDNLEEYNWNALCGTVTGYLKLAYDGTAYDCHGSIWDTHIDENKVTDSVFDQVRLYSAKHGRYLNLLTASDEEVDEFIDFYKKSQDPANTYFMYHQVVNLAYFMAKIGQIDNSYCHDFNKLKRHAFLCVKWGQCYTVLKLRNGSIFARGTEEIRQEFNGLLDEIEDYINNMARKQDYSREEWVDNRGA